MKLFVAMIACFVLGIAHVSVVESQDGRAETVKASDQAALFREPSDDAVESAFAHDPVQEPIISVTKPGASVHVREEFKFSSRQNIDSFLGEYENPFAAPENTYTGSRSEIRDDIDHRSF